MATYQTYGVKHKTLRIASVKTALAAADTHEMTQGVARTTLTKYVANQIGRPSPIDGHMQQGAEPPLQL